MKTLANSMGLVGCGLLAILLGCRKDPGEPPASAPAAGLVNSGPAVDQGRLPSVESGPAKPGPTIVQIEPIDMATSFGTTPMQVIVSNSGAPVGQTLLTQIGAAISLKTWPEQADVPITVSKIVDTIGQPGQDAYAHIYLTPTSPLADRWYALSVSGLPATVNWPAFPSMLPVAGGANVARFRPGSEPVVAGIRTYSKSGGLSVAYVDFSEHVTGSASAVQLTYADGTPMSCVVDDPAAPKPIANTTNAGVTPGKTQATTGFLTLSFNCSAAVDHGRAIVLSFAPGLKSTSAAAVYGGTPAQRIIAPTDWISWADGGNLWRGSP